MKGRLLPTIITTISPHSYCRNTNNLASICQKLDYRVKRAREGCLIKDDDKDNYLCEKFLNDDAKHFSWGCGSDIDRMIAEIYNIISRKQYIHDEVVDKLVDCLEISNLKADAIGALYNCVLRNPEKFSSKYYKETFENCLDDQRLHCVAERILGYLSDFEGVPNMILFRKYLDDIGNCINLDAAIEYINRQSINPQRHKLFDTILSTLTRVLKSDELGVDKKIAFCEIINNCLDHPKIKGLNQIQLNNCSYVLHNFQDTKLNTEVIRAILTTAEKKKTLPKETVESLVGKFPTLNDKVANLVIMTLGKICDKTDIPNIDNISSKLLDDRVIVEGVNNLLFEERSEENQDTPSLSSITSKIFVSALVKGTEVKEQDTLENIASAISKSNDKQTKILSAKALFIASEKYYLNDTILYTIRNYVQDKVPDIATYTTLAYLNGLDLLARKGDDIAASHIETLPKVYAFDGLKLQGVDYTQKVNNKVLSILFNEAAKQEFDESVFSIFNHILFLDNDKQETVLKILNKYTETKKQIPSSAIVALENAFGITKVSQLAQDVLKNVIMNGQKVSAKILQILTDNLYLADDESLRSETFKLLDTANDNQDLPKSVFRAMELQRAGNVIACNGSDKDQAIAYIKKKTDQGKKLPIDTLKSFITHLDNPEVLSILINISQNKQVIPNDLVNELVSRFKLGEENPQLMEIFTNIAKNNQNIPDDLLRQLELALDHESFGAKALSIFALKAQKCDKLPSNIVEKICGKFLVTDNLTLKQELAAAISSITTQELQNEQLDDKLIESLKAALIYALKQENNNVIESGISGFIAFAKSKPLDQESIDALVEKYIDSSDHVKSSINSILEQCQLSDTQTNKLKLAKLTDNSNEMLLANLLELSEKSPLLKQNFDQINKLIDQQPDLQLGAINALKQCKNKKDIPDELIKSITILSASTTSEEIKTACKELVEQAIEQGKALDENAKRLLDHPKPSILRTEADLDNLLNDLKNGIQLSDSILQNVLISKNSANTNLPKEKLTEISALIALQQSDNPQFIEHVENDILNDSINASILNIYSKIIEANKSLKLKDLISHLTEKFDQELESEESDIAVPLLRCFSNACSKLGFWKTPEKVLKILDENIYNEDPNIRSISFEGLIGNIREPHDLKSWELAGLRAFYKRISSDFSVNMGTHHVLSTELQKTLLSLKYIDYTKIAGKNQSEWISELLLSDLIDRCNTILSEKVEFRASWLSIDQNEAFKDGKSTTILKGLHEAFNGSHISTSELKDIIKFLPYVNFENANSILSNSFTIYSNFKQAWVKNLFTSCYKQPISSEYLTNLSINICNSFNVQTIAKLFNSIVTIESLRGFEHLLDFIKENNIKASDIYLQNSEVIKLQRSLEIKVLADQFKESKIITRQKIASTIDNLLDRKWTFEELKVLLDNINITEGNNKKYLIPIFEILDLYKLSPANYTKVLDIISKENPGCWLEQVNKIAVANNFQAIGKVKNTNELIEELKSKNSGNDLLFEFINSGNLLKMIREIKDEDLHSKNLSTCENPIAQWGKENITTWAKNFKSTPNIHDFKTDPEYITEVFSVIKRANFLVTGFHMTDAQIISCILALGHGKVNKGQLLQVATGEGKSTIISALAILNCLFGDKVDIMTSSPVLAERDAKEKETLYKIFGLSSADNNDKSLYIKGPKDCYSKDIIYGPADHFQFDTLRDEYSKLGTLADRRCKVAIVDEVDSMLIDDSSKTARLSSTIPGMDQLQPIYHFIWQKLTSMQERVIEIEGQIYYVYGKLGNNGNKITLEYANDSEEIIQVTDLKTYVQANNDISSIGQPIIGTIEEFINKHLKNYVDEILHKEIIKIPTNFKSFVEKQIAHWIQSAITAFGYQENVHYVVHEGVIKPVDYNSTGIVQSATNWSDGLHQFLQIKHELMVTSETFTTNFSSNMGYFKRYDNICGLTGTLGSDKAKEVLSEVYYVDLVAIPNLRQKQYIELPVVVSNNELQWINEICSSAKNEAAKHRGTLIICETIEYAQLISDTNR